MCVKRLICLLGAFWGICFAAAAQPQTLELESVMKSIEQSYPPLQESKQKLKAVEGKLLEKQGIFDTKIKTKAGGQALGYYRHLTFDQQLEQTTTLWGSTLYSGYRLGRGDFAEYDGKKATNNLGEWRAGLTLPLLRNGFIDPQRAELEILTLEYQIAEFQLQAKRLSIAQELNEKYWKWILYGHQYQLSQTLIQLARQRQIQFEKSVKLGETPPIYLVENQRSLTKQESKLVDLQRKWQEAAQDLSLYWRSASGLPQVPAAASLPRLDTQGLPQAGQTWLTQPPQIQRPEIEQLKLGLRQNAVLQKLLENQALPSLDLALEFSQDFGGGSKTRAPFEFLGQMALEWPLQMRKVEGQKLQLQAQQIQLEQQLQLLQEQIHLDFRKTQIAIEQSFQEVSLSRQAYVLSQKLAQAERDQFDLGESDLFMVNLREQAEIEQGLVLLEALSRFYQAQQALNLIQGRLLFFASSTRLSKPN